jgi:Fe-S-cluster containining protein
MKDDILVRTNKWRKFFPQLCSDCTAHCCRLPVEVKISDLITLKLVDEFDAEEDGKIIAKRLKNKGLVAHYNHKSEKFTLAQKGNRDCIFLDSDTRKCTVYDLRPTTCREFPMIGPKTDFCPYEKNEKKINK